MEARKKGGGVLCQRGAVKYAFIRDHARQFRVRVMCRVLGARASGYYAWRSRQPSPRVEQNQQLLQRIKTLHTQSRGIYGSPKIYRSLRGGGEIVNHKRVEKLMKEHAIRAKK